MPIFLSRTHCEILAALLLSDVELGLTDLAERLGAALSTAHREAERLEAAGVLTSTRVGNVRIVQVNRTSPAHVGPASRTPLGKPVDMAVRSPGAWSRKKDGFVRHVRDGPLIPTMTTEER